MTPALRRRLFRIPIYLLVLFLVLVALDLVLVQVRRSVRPGYDTTRVAGPVMPDGRIDYLLALDEIGSHGVTPKNNAAIPLLAVWGPRAFPSNQSRERMTQMLGMPPVPDAGTYFVTAEDFAKSHNASQPNVDDAVDQLIDHPGVWPTNIPQATRQWVDANATFLSRLTDASRRTRFFIPFYAGTRPDSLLEVLLPHVHYVRQTERYLVSHAVLRLDAGDAAGFRSDVLAVHRLARLVAGPTQRTLVERLVAFALERTACQVERAALAAGKLPPDAARALAGDLANLPDLDNVFDAVDNGERLMVLDMLQSAAKDGPRQLSHMLDAVSGIGRPAETHPAQDFLCRFWPVPYEEAMRHMNHYYDGAIAAAHQPTYAARRDAMARWEQQIQDLASRNPVALLLSPDWPAKFFVPALTTAGDRYEATRADLRLTRIALALAAYRADHQAYPTTLADLTPAYLPIPLDDPFADAPFAYRRTAAGYELHSTVPNTPPALGRIAQDLAVIFPPTTKPAK